MLDVQESRCSLGEQFDNAEELEKSMTGTQAAYFTSSTAISKAEYDSGSRVMTVYFAKGGQTDVPDVSVQEFRAFAESPSAGAYFNQNFKNKG